MPKREGYISWDELFMGIAELAAKRSKDPSTINGACIVKDNKVLSIGYNGLPEGLSDDGITDNYCQDYRNESLLKRQGGVHYDYWAKPDKYDWVLHAEENAILSARTDLTGAIIYVYSEKGYYPCSRCAGMIVQSRMSEVVMKTAIKEDTEVYNWDFTKHKFKMAGVKIRILNV